jgi:Rrf2 family protein
MLSKKAKYAIKALLTLAEEYHHNKPVLISTIAERNKIPKKFLESILLDLRNAGLVQSRQGRGGGYSLFRNPDQINLAQIIRTVEGPIALTPCVSLNFYAKCDDCIDEATCRLKRVMEKVRDANLKVLESSTLADVINQSSCPDVSILIS